MEIAIIVIVVLVLVVVFFFEITGITGAPYVPSKENEVKQAFTKLYKISEKDVVVDLGAGDGVVLKVASEHGAKAIGVELNPFMAIFMKIRFRKNKNVKIKCGDMYKFKLPKETTVVYAYVNMYAIPGVYKKVKREAKRLGKDLVLISNAFNLSHVKPDSKVYPHYLYKIKNEND